MSYTLEIQIPALPKTPNALLGAHWRVRSNHAKRWKQVIGMFAVKAGLPPEPLKKSIIYCTRLSSHRLDLDNLAGSFKCLIDALTFNRVIEDDTPDHVVIYYRHEIAPPKKGSIKIRVEEVGE